MNISDEPKTSSGLNWGLITPITLMVALVAYRLYGESGAEDAALFCIGALLLAGAIFLAARPWFWMTVFYLGAAASFLTMAAFAAQFQILAALGMCVLGFALTFLGRLIGAVKYNLHGFF